MEGQDIRNLSQMGVSLTIEPYRRQVVNILIELGIPYEIHSFKFADIKKPPFINLNPNGRVPAIVDPNTDLTIWESGAIVQYLVDVYDKDNKLTYDSFKEKHLLNQWLHFQMSGQGPYFGQYSWFNILSSEKVPAAIERYRKELLRILGVLNTVLENKTWLVGDKCTYADLSFLPWNSHISTLLECLPGDDGLAQFPNMQAWQKRMEERPAWKKAMQLRTFYMAQQGLGNLGMPEGVTSVQEYEEHIAKQAEGKTYELEH